MRSLLFAAVLISAVTNSSRAEDAPSPLTAPFDAEKTKAGQQAWTRHLGRPSPVEKNSIGMELVLIPPGTFTMGSPPSEVSRVDDEMQVEVTLTNGFYLGKTEVTQGQWKVVMETTPWSGKRFVQEGDNYPATYVNWDDAKAFCKRLSEREKGTYRLPTEAEWEYGCRGGTTTIFSFENDESRLGDYAWYTKNALDAGGQYAHEVGRKLPNPFGLDDMHGNVWEWCEDMYADKLPGGADPLVSTGGSYRVYRGGGWVDLPADCRTANRNRNQPSFRIGDLGFRVARNSGK